MPTALFRTFRQIADPAFRRLLWRGAWVAMAAMVALWAIAGLVAAKTTFFETVWLEGLFDIGGFVAIFVLTFLLFPGFVTLGLGFFLEDACEAIEAKDYPRLPPARRQGFAEIFLTTAMFTGLLVFLNLLALPVYFLPVVGPFLFFAVTGFLLGREYADLVTARRLKPEAAKAFRKTHGWSIFAAGMTIAVLSTIPGINLIAPVLGTTLMLHLFERHRESRA